MTNGGGHGGGKRAFGHSIFDAMVSSGALIVMTLLTGIILSRLLGPEGRGQYGSVTFWASFSAHFLTFSIFDAALIKLRGSTKPSRSQLPSLLFLALVLTLLAAALGVVLVPLQVVAVAGVSPALLLAFLLAHFAVAAGHKAFSVVELGDLSFALMHLERVITAFLLMLATLALWLLGQDALWLLLTLFVLVKLPNYVPRVLRYRGNLTGPVDKPFLAESARLGWRLNLSQGALGLANDADRLVLISLWPATMLGYYFVAMSACGAALSLAGQAIQLTLLPSLSGLEKEEKRRKLEQLLRVSILISAGVVAGVWLTAPFLIPLVFGAEFAPAVPYARGLVFASVIKLVISILTIAHFSEEKVMPGMLTAGSFLLVFLAGFAMTQFAEPEQFFGVLALANLASLAVALVLLKRDGLISLRAALVPRPADVTLLAGTMRHYLLAIRVKRA